ncbi:MAG TPA: 5-deoxy-glucuronate isomerase, partial [Gaiellaceae bacterium]|nr:5-deoxy-glucuronate isomerase [Gaiellaceae bacterium]
MSGLLIPARERPELAITPESAGWTYCGLRIVRIPPGEHRQLGTGGEEFAVLPLAGSAVVEVDGLRFELEGRSSVFARVSDWAYLPIGSKAVLSSDAGAELALASARAERRFEPAYVAAADVPIEVRGAGQATRQLTNFLAPGSFDACDRLICVEALT